MGLMLDAVYYPTTPVAPPVPSPACCDLHPREVNTHYPARVPFLDQKLEIDGQIPDDWKKNLFQIEKEILNQIKS